MKRSLIGTVCAAVSVIPALAAGQPAPRDARVTALVEAAAAEQSSSERQRLFQAALGAQLGAPAERGASGRLGRLSTQIAGGDDSDRARHEQVSRSRELSTRMEDFVTRLRAEIRRLFAEWTAGGGRDDALLGRIENLQAELDRLQTSREAQRPGEPNLGARLTDRRGQYGYDRDQDGVVDVPVGADGVYAPPVARLGTARMGAPRLSRRRTFGPILRPADEPRARRQRPRARSRTGRQQRYVARRPSYAGEQITLRRGADEVASASPKSLPEQEPQLEPVEDEQTIAGRLVVLPKAQPASSSAGSSDGWQDQPLGESASQIVQVEMAIVEWQRERQFGPGGWGAGLDPLAHVRDAEGRIDRAQVELWIVADASWHEGGFPVRYRLVGTEVWGHHPIVPGAVATVSGVPEDLEGLDPQFRGQLEGVAHQLRLTAVVDAPR